jgi:hypothetical protein
VKGVPVGYAKNGRPRSYETPEDFWAKFVEYKEWIDANPVAITESKTRYGDDYENKEKFVPRAMTVTGFCVFAGIRRSTYYEYANQDGFTDICASIESVMFDQKFVGASSGLLNHSIIARELGLADKKDHTSSDGSMTPATVDLSKLTSDQLRQLNNIATSIESPSDQE